MLVLPHTPAFIRRAFFISISLATLIAQAGPPPTATPPPANYLQFGQPDQEEGRKVLAAFRRAGIPGQYYLEFDIRVMPRRGEERVLAGKLWGSRNDEGPISRVAVTAEKGERRLLIQNGEDAAVWSVDLGGASTNTRIVDSFEPLVPGIELTAFELQMPYVYWPDATLERVSRVRSRPAHVFFFRPPAAWAAQHPDIRGVRAYLDTQFNVPVQSEIIGQDQRVLRTLSLVDLAKVGDQYIPKSIDLRNDQTRDKVRFQVTGAALNSSFKANIFEPGQLTEPVPAPPPKQIMIIGG
ncbi:MAG: hypothetical protein JWM32_870 [Verrucomicrobia bacterium]|nr:hypothetical protein [Verrucomicrobiota bacterium]